MNQNDDLRNRSGLLSRKEQERLQEENHALVALNADLKCKVNMSNIKAVEDAVNAQKASEAKAKAEIAACNAEASRQVKKAEDERKEAVHNAKLLAREAKKKQQIAWGALFLTLLCCLIKCPVLIFDLWDFLAVPIDWTWNSLNDGAYWVILIIAGLVYGGYLLARYYIKRWCNLSLKVVMASLAAVIVFGDTIQKYVHCNLVLLFSLVQVAYLGVLIYLDGYYDTRKKQGEWKKLQNV